MRKLLFLSFAAGLAAAAWAQTNTVVVPAKKKMPASQELGVSAASFTYSQEKNQAIYAGQVVVTNAQGKLTCEQLTIDLPAGGSVNTQPTNIVAETNVVVDFIRDNDTNHVTCDKAVYAYSRVNQVTNETITFIGTGTNRPEVTNSKVKMWGEPLIWDNISGHFSAVNTETILVMPDNSGGTNTVNPFNLGK